MLGRVEPVERATHPLDSGARHRDDRLGKITALAPRAPCHERDRPGRLRRRISRTSHTAVEVDETPGAMHAHDLAGADASQPDRAGLLIADGAEDKHGDTTQLLVCSPVVVLVLP